MTVDGERQCDERNVPRRATGAESGQSWLLGMLVCIYASNFVDRTIVSVLQQPIKSELEIQDWQLGLLGGTTFAVFYTVLGIFVARLAEKRDRIWVLTACIVAWSLFTALCGAVGSFAQLLLLRVGVATGEAGATPTGHSLISDRYPPHRRAGALAIFASGNTIGNVLGALIGATVGAAYGWRWAFLIAGAPGLLLALVTRMTLSDPRRSMRAETGNAVPPLREVARLLFGKTSFRQLAIAASLMLFGAYAVIYFATAHMMRTYAMPLGKASLTGGIGAGVMLGVGTVGGGFLAQRLARRDRRWLVWTIALSMALAAPLCMLAFLLPAFMAAMVCFLAMMVCLGVWQGPLFGALHSLVQPRMRATASAILLLVITLFGLGLGPLALGIASDHLAALFYGSGAYQTVCHAGVAADVRCAASSAAGLRTAMAACGVVFAWAAVHFTLAGRALPAEEEI